MKAHLKQKWIEALRSGKYQQGRGTLRCGDEFCCLGVLADVSALGKFVTVVNDEEPEFTHQEFEYLGESNDQLLPHTFRRAVGIDEWEQTKLWELNDLKNKSFVEIADFVEAKIPSDAEAA